MDRPAGWWKLSSEDQEFNMFAHSPIRGNTVIISIIPAACLSLLTLGSVSLYGAPADLTLPFITLIAIFILTPVIVLLHRKNHRD
jgi:hypothetical protein